METEAAAIRELVAIDLRVVVTADTSMLSVIGALVDAVPGVCAAAPTRLDVEGYGKTPVNIVGAGTVARFAPEFRRNGVRVTETAMRTRLARG